jgi:uncharacterized protein YbjQ (UPF0145 family)
VRREEIYLAQQNMILATTKKVPGYKILEYRGLVMGVTVRSRGYFAAWCASFQTCAGGEISQYTTQLLETRNESLNRMVADAQARGANAIVGIKFDNDELGSKKASSKSDMTIANNATVAVGTAVIVQKL